MIPRSLESPLRQAARKYPVVTLTGPRQSGKTTLVRAVFDSYDYASLEEPDTRAFALEDPRGFLGQFQGGVVIDEAQRVPDLFSYIQTIVDSEDRAGRFILSGSQNFLLLRSISQSLAGRTAVLHLLPLSLSELAGRDPLALERIGGDDLMNRPAAPFGLMETLHAGFYPRIHDKSLDAGSWLSGYYQTYVERDVREVVNVGDLEAFGRFLRLSAGRVGQLLNLSSLADDCGITHTTAKRWLSILETSFLVTVLRPHYRNFSKRLIKRPKLYFLDSGLLCYLLRIRSPEELVLNSSRGAIFEGFVLSELVKNFFNRGAESDLYFWRDSAGHEIDLVMERGQELVAMEIKSGQTLTSDSLKGLEFWKDLVGEPETPTALFYGGDQSFNRSGTTVYSWRLL